MATDEYALKIANDSGFPLQIAIAAQVSQSTASHGWKVRYAEHSWTNRVDGTNGFIDLVLEDRHQSTVQDIGQGTNAGLDHVDPREGLTEHVLIEETDTLAVDRHGTPRMGVDQIREVAFEFVGGEVVGNAIDILRESAYGEGIGFDGFGGFCLGA